jgi:hypothetical protein
MGRDFRPCFFPSRFYNQCIYYFCSHFLQLLKFLYSAPSVSLCHTVARTCMVKQNVNLYYWYLNCFIHVAAERKMSELSEYSKGRNSSFEHTNFFFIASIESLGKLLEWSMSLCKHNYYHIHIWNHCVQLGNPCICLPPWTTYSPIGDMFWVVLPTCNSDARVFSSIRGKLPEKWEAPAKSWRRILEIMLSNWSLGWRPILNC